MVRKYVKNHRRRKPSGGFTDVVGHYRNIKTGVKQTIPTTVDDQIIDLMLENNIIAENIDVQRKKLGSVLSPKGTEKRKKELQTIVEIKQLKRKQKVIAARIVKLYNPLPQARKSSIIREYNRRTDFSML